jgi:hypothetical protein
MAVARFFVARARSLLVTVRFFSADAWSFSGKAFFCLRSLQIVYSCGSFSLRACELGSQTFNVLVDHCHTFKSRMQCLFEPMSIGPHSNLAVLWSVCNNNIIPRFTSNVQIGVWNILRSESTPCSFQDI